MEVDDPRDKDSPLKYDCSDCPAMTRAIRNCPLWPPPEVEALHEVAKDRVPANITRAALVVELAAGGWQVGAQFGNADKLNAAIRQGDMNRDGDRCAVLNINGTSRRFLNLYQKVQTFAGGMGGIPAPRGTLLDEDVRTIHAFHVIAGESERIRKSQREARKEG